MKILENIRYSDASENCLLDVSLPDEPQKGFTTFVYFHGGGLKSGTRRFGEHRLNEYLTDRGIAVVSADYRMYPQAKYPEFIVDAVSAVAWTLKNIASYGGDEKKVFVGGSSAGGYLSMMLCYDRRYYEAQGVDPSVIAGYIHDAGQPTTHFNVCLERGLDTRRLIVDEASPMYYVGLEKEYPPQMFIVSDDDMKNRYEQTMLMLSTLRHFGYDESKFFLKTMHGTHCAYCGRIDEDGLSAFGKLVYEGICAFI